MAKKNDTTTPAAQAIEAVSPNSDVRIVFVERENSPERETSTSAPSGLPNTSPSVGDHMKSAFGVTSTCSRDLESLGLHNVVVRANSGPLEGCECSLGADCNHVRTQRHDNSTFPW